MAEPSPRRKKIIAPGMSRPAVLALDFDGVLCDGLPEYFETSCRTYGHFWSPRSLDPGRAEAPFHRLRWVVESGWEMPLLLRAIVVGAIEECADGMLVRPWTTVRDELLSEFGARRERARALLGKRLDQVRDDWIRLNPAGWLARHTPYFGAAELRRLLTRAPHTAIVTTKEGRFVRRLLRHWKVGVRDVQGKETGKHKCENLLQLLARAGAPDGDTGSVWFVEDRLATLRCVLRCAESQPELSAVKLFLATWGYNAPDDVASLARDPGIRALPREELLAALG